MKRALARVLEIIGAGVAFALFWMVDRLRR